MTLLDDRPVDETPAMEATPHPRGAAAGAGRWRLAARLARRELRRRPWRTCLVALLVAAPVMAVLLVDVAYRSHRLPDGAGTFGRAAGIVDLYGVDPATFDDELVFLAPDRFEHLAWFEAFLPLRSAAQPDVLVGASVSTLDATNDLAAGIVDLRHGRLPAGDDEVLVSIDVARRLDVRIGDELTLVRPEQTFTVVGIGTIDGGPTFLAPGFDVGALRADRLGAEILVGRDGASDADAFRRYLSSVDLGFVGSSRPTSGWSYRERSDQSSDDPVQLFFGWLGGTLLMGAMGIVVGAAFAISGRRQLVTIGQLSATGADRSLLRRFLALQGTWTGVAGAVIGVAGTALVTRFAAGWLRSSGGLDVRWLDWAVVGATAVVVATVAALVPARSLATMSTLTALGGRRPVPPLHPRQLRLGAGVLAAGVIGLTLSVVMAREANDVGATLTIPILVAMLAGGGVLIGVCCLGPVWVSMLARVGVRRRGVGRLATRDLDRHRVRSGALIAAVMVVGAAAVAVGATLEQMHRQHLANREIVAPESTADVVYVDAYRTDESSSPVDVDVVDPLLRDRIESVLGHVTWVPDTTVHLAGDELPYVAVASADLLALQGFRPDEIERIMGADVALVSGADQPPMFDRDDLLRRLGAPAGTTVVEVSAAEAWIGSGIVYMSADLAEQLGDVTTAQWYGRTDHDITDGEAEALDGLAGGLAEMEAESFIGVPSVGTMVSVGIGQAVGNDDWTGVGRWATINVALLLVLLVVGLGLALESAEGRDDLDTLVALGASPSTLARVAAWKAGLLAGVGGVLSVPLGYGALWLCIHAARRETTFPWIVAVGVAVVVPIVVAAIAFVVRRQARPAHRALEPWS